MNGYIPHGLLLSVFFFFFFARAPVPPTGGGLSGGLFVSAGVGTFGEVK